jgi:hypothetical protein
MYFKISSAADVDLAEASTSVRENDHAPNPATSTLLCTFLGVSRFNKYNEI